MKKSYIEAKENFAIREYYEIIDQYNEDLIGDIAKRFDDPEDHMHGWEQHLAEFLRRLIFVSIFVSFLASNIGFVEIKWETVLKIWDES